MTAPAGALAACCQQAWTAGARAALEYLVLAGLVDRAAVAQHHADLTARRPAVVDVNALDQPDTSTKETPA